MTMWHKLFQGIFWNRLVSLPQSLRQNLYNLILPWKMAAEEWEILLGLSFFLAFLRTDSAHLKLLKLYRAGQMYLNGEITDSAAMFFFSSCLIICNMNSRLQIRFSTAFLQLIIFRLWSFWPTAVFKEVVQEEKKKKIKFRKEFPNWGIRLYGTHQVTCQLHWP